MKQTENNHNYPFLELNKFTSSTIVFGLLVLQFLICVYGLFQKPLWLDEAYSAVIARLSIPEIHQALLYDAGPPLYYDALHIWRLMFGESESALRFFSLLCSMITTIMIFLFCDKQVNREAAICAALFWVVSPLSVFYATEARNYTFLTALTVVYIYFFYLYIQTNKIHNISLCTVLLILLMYTHNTVFYLIPAVMIVVLSFFKKWKTCAGLFASILIVFLAYIPWMNTLQHQLRQSELTIGWIKAFWSWMMPLYTFTAFVPGGYMPVYMDMPQFPVILQWIFYALFSGMAVYSIYCSMRQKKMGILYIINILGIVLAAAVLQSAILTPTYLAGRTDFMVYPFWCVLVGYGITQLPSANLRISAGICIFISCIAANGMIYTKPTGINERELIKTLNYHLKDEDIIICTGLTRPIVEYAFGNQKATIFSYPTNMERHLAHLNEQWYLENVNLDDEARTVLDQVVNAKTENKKIIILWSGRAINMPLNNLIASNYNHLTKNEYSHPNMGLSRLNEPISLWILQ